MGWDRIALVAVALCAALLAAGWLRDDVLLLTAAVAGLGAVAGLWLVRRRRRGRGRRRPSGRRERGHIPRSVRQRIYARDGYACRYCGRRRGHAVRLELDHFYPFALGGSDRPDNLVTSCHTCNRAKGTRVLRDEADVRRFVAEREAAVAAMTRADWRRVLWRDLLATVLLLVLVVGTYLALTVYVW
jgi:hypothetical protein